MARLGRGRFGLIRLMIFAPNYPRRMAIKARRSACLILLASKIRRSLLGVPLLHILCYTLS